MGVRPGVDVLAFDQLFAEHHDRLLRIALLIAGDPTVAEDAVAEVFARVLRRFDQLTLDDPGAYLRRCVVNELTSSGRRRTKGAALQLVAATDPTAGSTAEGRAAFDDRIDERERVLAALRRLPTRQCAAIVLRFYDDRSEAETAQVLGVPAGTVKSTVARGLARLRELLREEDRHG